MASRINKYTILVLIFIAAFLIRLIPSRNFSFAGNDAYIHHDIIMRISSQGFGIIPSDPLSLLGLKAYAYPPLYHIIGAILYKIFDSQSVFFILPPFLGVLSILVFYKLSMEVLEDREKSILSTFLFAMVPSFVCRTSVLIPESMGLLLFVTILYLIIKYVKTIPGYADIDNFTFKSFFKIFDGNPKYLAMAFLVFTIYLFTHRGWVFLAITLIIFVMTFLIPSFKKRPLEFSFIFLLAALGFLWFVSSAGRFQSQPVTVLGFPKWMGLIQLICGFYGVIFFIRSKNPIWKFIALWFLIFIAIGTYSFRFRDPYAAIPLSLMAGYGFVEILTKLYKMDLFHGYRIFKKNISPQLKIIILGILIFMPIAQGAVIAYSNVVTPTIEQIEVFEWIKDNTPSDSIFLATRDDAYLLIGNTHRRDILLWKTFYQGFMGNPPSPKEKEMTENEVKTIFTSSQPQEAYYFLEENNITYIYVRKDMHQQGLGLYMPTDTHFKTLIVSGDASVYKYIPKPPLNAGGAKINSSKSPEYTKIVEFIEKFWNGYSYSEAGEYTLDDPTQDLEFGSAFKGSYDSNAMIANLYNELYSKTGDESFRERSNYLIKWLEYKQMDNGSFPGGMPPAEYTLTTMQTIYPLIKSQVKGSENIIKKGLNFVNNQKMGDEIQVSSNKRSIQPIGVDYLKLKTEAQVSGMNPNGTKNIIYNVMEKQGADGSWTPHSYENIEILKGLALYYMATKDNKVLRSLQGGAKWLRSRQYNNGKFKDDGESERYCISHYADALLIYYVIGDKDAIEKTLSHIQKRGIKDDPTPLKSYLTLLWNLKLIYGEDTALKLSSKML